MSDILGKPRSKIHRCGNCIGWHMTNDPDIGYCDFGDMSAVQGFDGNGVMTDDNRFRTTADTYCDYQVPIPEPGPPCPKCGEPTGDGFGLAGGGYGPYTYCTSDACDYFDKVFLGDDEE